MSPKCSAGPPAGSSGSLRRRLRLRALALLLFPLLSAAALRLPYAPLQAHLASLAGVRLTDRHGRFLAAIPGARGAFSLRLGVGEIPPEVERIFVRLEDRRFFRHRGVDPLALARAARDNLRRGGVVSGASTITMQLARLLEPHRGGFRGKLRESLAALRLETVLDKREILRLYLNLLPFGRNTVGAGAAAMAYFDRPLQELSPAQLLLLATLPRAPSLLDPFRNPGALGGAALAFAPRAGIPAAEVRQALTTLRRGRPQRLAPHFVLYVENDLPRLAALRAGGRQIVQVTTTLDLELYSRTAQRLDRELARSEGASRPALRDAAAVVLDNAAGEILAYVGAPGSRPAGPHAAVDAARVRNPSGSTLKPFLYALALERGWTCASLLPDLSLSFGSPESYRPENFDRRSRGLVRARTALAGSLNVPAVYLLSRLGLPDFLRTLSRLGLEPGPAGDLGLGAAIGNAPVSLVELTRAFSVFPRGGLLPPLSAVRALVTAEGLSLPAAPLDGPRVFSRESAWLIGSVLSDPSARATGFGTRSRLNAPFPAMFKSGTASGYFSLWCLGATRAYTVGIWAGSLERRQAPGATGSSVPATVARGLLEELQGRLGPGGSGGETQSASPPALESTRICALTGYLASPACPGTRDELFRQGTLPRLTCPVHGAGQGLEELALELFLEGGKGPRVLYPRDGATFYQDLLEAPQDIPAWIAARRQETLEVRLNGESRALKYPFRLDLPVRRGNYLLEVIGESGRDAVRYEVR